MRSLGERPATRTVLAVLVATLALALALAACGSDGGSDEADEAATTTAPTTSSTADASTTTTAGTATTTASGQPGDPRGYAAAVVQAWEAGDRDRALELATEEAVEVLFAEESAGSHSLVGCSVHRGSTFCLYEGDRSFGLWVDNDAATGGQPQAVLLVT